MERPVVRSGPDGYGDRDAEEEEQHQRMAERWADRSRDFERAGMYPEAADARRRAGQHARLSQDAWRRRTYRRHMGHAEPPPFPRKPRLSGELDPLAGDSVRLANDSYTPRSFAERYSGSSLVGDKIKIDRGPTSL